MGITAPPIKAVAVVSKGFAVYATAGGNVCKSIINAAFFAKSRDGSSECRQSDTVR